MSRPVIIIIAEVAFILLAFITAIPLFERFKEYSLFKKIYIMTAVILLFLVGCLDVYIRASDPTETDKLIDVIKSIGMNNKRNTLPEVKSKLLTTAQRVSKKENKPFALIRFSPFFIPNPVLIKTEKSDSLTEKYAVTNYGTGAAYRIKSMVFFATLRNGHIQVQPNPSTYIGNKTQVIPADPKIALPAQVPVKMPKRLDDTVYFCYKLDFSDSTKKRKAFSKIYLVDFKRLEYFELEDAEYNKVESYLIKNKYWNSPFRQ